MTKLIDLIRKLIDSKFYGELLIRFDCGKIVIVKKTESIKIDN